MTTLRQYLRFAMTSRRLGMFLCLIGFIWSVTLMNLTLVGLDSTSREAEDIKSEILELSERYVKTLAKETENTLDGPFAGRITGYDLKKTMAVLLDDIMLRLNKLEQRADALANHTLARGRPEDWGQVQQKPNIPPPNEPPKVQPETEKNPVNMQGLIMGEQEHCELTDSERMGYPQCSGKLKWMTDHWTSDACYREFGVDGSFCSFRVYLSEVETWCPVLPGRKAANHTRLASPAKKNVTLNFNLEGLMSKLHDPGQRKNYAWMRVRIKQLWQRWVTSAKELAKKQDLTGVPQKKIHLYIGAISRASNFHIIEELGSGGPLGELVQWSDIITALYILGHDLTITSEVEQLQSVFKPKSWKPNTSCKYLRTKKLDLIYTDYIGKKQIAMTLQTIHLKHPPSILSTLPKAESLCQSRHDLPIDMVYTDIVGLTQFKKKVKGGFGKFSCLLRIIDSFGTEPAFNWEPYAKTHRLKTMWGMQNLKPQQFFTMFPHSPDNSFMGFVVENHLNESSVVGVKKKNQALVYGKAEYMWQEKSDYISIIQRKLEVHGTVFIEETSRGEMIPKGVINHGILSGPDLHRLLRESKVFVGLGFPYEGPAPLEAIVQGCVFINPKFNPPHSSVNNKFFKGKPTQRSLSSQHPYIQDFIGEPYVYTVNINDANEVQQAVAKALKAHEEGKISNYLPFEYTEQGMLQRLSAYIKHQDFCNPHPELWPPEGAVEVVLGQIGRSCKDVCRQKDKICEPSHFHRINTQTTLERFVGPCVSKTTSEEIYLPAFEPVNQKCHLQAQMMLFSCVGDHTEMARLCPCRDFIPGQTALCRTCLS